MKQETIALHGGYDFDKEANACAVPIYQTAAYLFRDAEHGANLFALKEEGNIYTRLGNPTTSVLEERVRMLEGGTACVAVATGQAATTYAIMALASSGDEIISSTNVYGGTYSLFSHTLKNYGITTRFVSSTDPREYKKSITEKTKCIFIESLPNPSLTILDYKEIAKIAEEAHIPLIVDNTVPTPYLHKPKDYGAHIVVHSLTKYMAGHGTTLAGAIVDLGTFDWKSSNIKSMTEPDMGYHGLVFADAFENYKDMGNSAFAYKVRLDLLRDMGGALSPMSAFLVLMGIETLHLRMPCHSNNAKKLASYLIKHPKISWVNYPGIKETTDENTYNLAKEYFKLDENSEPMVSGLLAFGIKGGRQSGAKFIDNVSIIRSLVNLGDAKSIATHPASTTHSQLTEEELKMSGVGEDLIRFSVGIENIDDIIEDIDNSLKKV